MGKECTRAATEARDALRVRIEALLKHVNGVRREDLESIHDMRVASRRLRATLREFRPALPGGECRRLLEDAREITRLLGRPRELDVMIEMLEAYRESAQGAVRRALPGILRAVRLRRTSVAGDCAQTIALVESEAFRTTAALVLDGCRPSRGCLIKRARRRLADDYRDLCAQYAGWLSTEDEAALHRLRIAFKKIRYACERYAPLYGEAMNEFLRSSKATQEVLGAWNDCRVLRNELLSIMVEVPAHHITAFPKLIMHFDEQGVTHQAAFRALAEEFFATNHRNEARYLFGHPEAPCCAQ